MRSLNQVMLTISLVVFSSTSAFASSYLSKSILSSIGYLAGITLVAADTIGYCKSAIIVPNDDGTMSWTCEDADWEDSIAGVKCFSEDTEVYLQDGTSKEIGTLRRGDIILDGKNKPTSFIGWLHRVPKKQNEIYYFGDIEEGCYLKVSAKHLLFDGDGNEKSAESFKEGDSLMLADGSKMYLNRAPHKTIENTTMFAPLTSSGTIKVGRIGVNASCYAEVESHLAADNYVQAKAKIYPPQGNIDIVDRNMLRLIKSNN